MKLHHTVNHKPEAPIAKAIELNGLIPQVAGAYKDLVPEEIRHLPIVWLAEGIWQGHELPVFEVDSKDLDGDRLYPTIGEPELHWWVYQGNIPPEVIIRIGLKTSFSTNVTSPPKLAV